MNQEEHEGHEGDGHRVMGRQSLLMLSPPGRNNNYGPLHLCLYLCDSRTPFMSSSATRMALRPRPARLLLA